MSVSQQLGRPGGSRVDPAWRRRKNAIFWVVWLVLFGLTCFPPVVTWINGVDGSALGTNSPIMIWVLALILAQIAVIWINYGVEDRSGELHDDVEPVDWERIGGRPEISELFSEERMREAQRAMSSAANGKEGA